ncbi:hypothetical protein [Ruminococcus sp.]|uniref:hypothetical protein n=1 Tax=Ruminococcus sp. TaxID=41978 RepID=UPI003F7F649F
MIDCSKTKNYLTEKLRLTKKHKPNDDTYTCEIACDDCPLSCSNNGMNIPCTNFEKSYPEKAIEIVQKWSNDHPQKTYLSEFLKNYPNAPLDDDGTPKMCPWKLGLKCDEDRCLDAKPYCVKCWNQAIEE